jgi:MinD superfamily P-loop ATPase
MVAVNKHDINAELTEKIEGWCRRRGVPSAGRVHASHQAVCAMIAGKTIVEHDVGSLAAEIRALWTVVQRRLGASASREQTFVR